MGHQRCAEHPTQLNHIPRGPGLSQHEAVLLRPRQGRLVDFPPNHGHVDGQLGHLLFRQFLTSFLKFSQVRKTGGQGGGRRMWTGGTRGASAPPRRPPAPQSPGRRASRARPAPGAGARPRGAHTPRARLGQQPGQVVRLGRSVRVHHRTGGPGPGRPGRAAACGVGGARGRPAAGARPAPAGPPPAGPKAAPAPLPGCRAEACPRPADSPGPDARVAPAPKGPCCPWTAASPAPAGSGPREERRQRPLVLRKGSVRAATEGRPAGVRKGRRSRRGAGTLCRGRRPQAPRALIRKGPLGPAKLGSWGRS